MATKLTNLHPSIEERTAAGKALRDRVSRKSQGKWKPAANRPDPIELLKHADEGRLPELLPIRYGRMSQSPFAFFRGAAALMAFDLSSTPATGLRVQACGDCHIGNFGGFGSPERRLVFDINDFDETSPAPWEWDVKRLATSVVLAARQNKFGRTPLPGRGAARSEKLPRTHAEIRSHARDRRVVFASRGQYSRSRGQDCRREKALAGNREKGEAPDSHATSYLRLRTSTMAIAGSSIARLSCITRATTQKRESSSPTCFTAISTRFPKIGKFCCSDIRSWTSPERWLESAALALVAP